MNDEAWSDLWKRRCDVLARCELSALYHRRRERFFASLDKWGKAVAVIGGSAAISRLLPDWAVVASGATIAITSTLSLVFALADKARLHADLASRFVRLAATVHACGLHCVEEDATRWETQLSEIEALEPPQLTALVRLCQNDLAWAKGQPHRVYRIGFWERIFAHWIDFPTRRLEPIAVG